MQPQGQSHTARLARSQLMPSPDAQQLHCGLHLQHSLGLLSKDAPHEGLLYSLFIVS